jgi:hypothetical protein
MTKFNTLATTCLAMSGLALAQTAPAPASSASAAPRTGLYGSVTKGNIAADNTVDDYSRRPTLIGDKQYIAGFGGADLANAAFSIKGMGWNWFGAVTGPVPATPGVPNTLRLGLGSGTAWGAGLLLAVDRTHVKNAAGETTTYFDASGFGAFGDFALGASDVYGALTWNTGFPTTPPALPHNSVIVNPAVGANTENIHHTLGIMAGWKHDATTEGTHSFLVEGTYQMATHTTDGITPEVDDKVNILTVTPGWGYILRANSDYAVFVGVNSTESFQSDEVGATDGSQYSLSLSPNIAFQKQLGRGFEGFSGFSVTAMMSSASDEPADGDESSTLLTGGADMAVGLRWVKDNLAFEGSLREAVLANGPYIIGGNAGQGLFFNIGLSLGI